MNALAHAAPYEAARGSIARTFQNVRAVSRHDHPRQHHGGPQPPRMRPRHVLVAASGRRLAGEVAHRIKVEEIIDFLRKFTQIRRTPVGPAAYGLQKRVELGRALAMEPELLLLDEPMAGMNIEEKEDMSRFIIDVNNQFGTTIALIEHDMGVVMDLSDRVVVLDYGRKIADGTPDQVKRTTNA